MNTSNVSFSKTAETYDLIITNARIIDGTGNPWFYGSIAVKHGIKRIENPETRRKIVNDLKKSLKSKGF